jgi:hypothetical protein
LPGELFDWSRFGPGQPLPTFFVSYRFFVLACTRSNTDNSDKPWL